MQKNIHHDAVRSSKSTLVKCSGLKWLILAVSWRFPFSKRHFTLPFMTVLEPSERSDKAAGRIHKTTMQWTIQMLKQVVRWLVNVPIILVGDGGFACGRLAWACLKHNICLISRLKMNACLYDFPDTGVPGKRGRKQTKGVKLFSFKEMVGMPNLGWREATIQGYCKKDKKIRYITNTSLWGGCKRKAIMSPFLQS